MCYHNIGKKCCGSVVLRFHLRGRGNLGLAVQQRNLISREEGIHPCVNLKKPVIPCGITGFSGYGVFKHPNRPQRNLWGVLLFFQHSFSPIYPLGLPFPKGKNATVLRSVAFLFLGNKITKKQCYYHKSQLEQTHSYDRIIT